MKISYNWLKNYLDLDPIKHSPEVLAEALPLLGFDVETLEEIGPPQLKNVVVGEVLTFEQHPNADRLRCCLVKTDAEAEPHKIVCGAKNFAAGDRVMVALPGAVLPGDFKIKKSKLRGEPSEGMLCSAKELQVGQDSDGILVLDKSLSLGTPLNQVFSDDDIVLSLEITPNRVDVLSHLGVARELAARFDLKVKYPEVLASTTNPPKGGSLLQSIEVNTPEVCPQYTTFSIRGVKVAPSPEWLKNSIEAIGLRSINNIVDVTNYVLYETGQPLHAFDASKISGQKLVIRQATEDETITTLDAVERKLDASMTVIADAERPLVIAGVMGSVDAEVDSSTSDIVLETAYFEARSIRATSRSLGLSTDSSYRFERGIDPKGLLYASLRAVDLILKVAGGEVEGDRAEIGAEPETLNAIEFYPERVRRFIGFEVDDGSLSGVLESLDFVISKHTEANGTDRWEVAVPSYRCDLMREVDLIEEFVRMYGTDKIPETEVSARGIAANDHRAYTTNRAVANYLTGQNFNEAFLYSLRDPEETNALFGPAAHQKLILDNPLQSDQSHLRSSLLPGLLDVLKLNVSRGTGATRFFERGHVYQVNQDSLTELVAFGFVIAGSSENRLWKERESADFYTARTLCENILELAGLPGAKLSFEPQESSPLWQGGQSGVGGDLKRMGFECSAGLLNVATLRDRWDLEFPVIAGVVEIKPECFLRRAKRARYSAVSNQPSSTKDIALIVDEEILAGQVQSQLAKFAKKALKGFLCESVSCFDCYNGEGLPEGKKSLALSLSFRASDRTLKDKEVNAAFDAIQSSILSQTDYQIRK
jgi:phenylalanyl-tRNA synthetase beta chain